MQYAQELILHRRFEQAEKVLREAEQGCNDEQRPQVLQLMIRLYTQWDNPEQVAAQRAKMSDALAKAAAAPATPPASRPAAAP
jgi:hypothetical protein